MLEELLTKYEGWIKLITSLVAGLCVIWNWVYKPLKDVKTDVATMETKLNAKIDTLDDSTTDKIASFTRETKDEMKGFIADVKNQTMDVREGIGGVQAMTDALAGDRLAQAHAYWLEKQYCPKDAKYRLIAMHDMYSARGLNTLEKDYNEKLLRLPDEPPKGNGLPL